MAVRSGAHPESRADGRYLVVIKSHYTLVDGAKVMYKTSQCKPLTPLQQLTSHGLEIKRAESNAKCVRIMRVLPCDDNIR
jgi:hypothetical protein